MAIELETPFPLFHVPRIWGWAESFRDKVADDYAPKTVEEFVEQWQRKEANGQRSWAVNRDGEMGGVIHSEVISPGVRSVHAMFKREFWGHATTLPAMQKACKELFDDGARKLIALIFFDNHASKGLAMALGGEREGTLKAETIRHGQPIDIAIIAIHREGFEHAITVQRRLPKSKREANQQRAVQQHDEPAAADAKPESGAAAERESGHGKHLEDAHAVSAEPAKPAVLLRVNGSEQPVAGNSADLSPNAGSGLRDLQRASR